MTDKPNPWIQGHCPACGRNSLFVGEGGYITCSHIDCPEPDAASTLLEHDPRAGHRYLSTGCLHGEHAYCQGKTGQVGAKTPAKCKFCDARCICDCHREAPVRIAATTESDRPAPGTLNA